jgi:PKD repeat protein
MLSQLIQPARVKSSVAMMLKLLVLVAVTLQPTILQSADGTTSWQSSYIELLAPTPIEGLSATNTSPTLVGSSTTFIATISQGTDISYQWNFGDGQSGNGASAVHTYNRAGAYIAMVTATNSLGSATATTPVTITGCDGNVCLFAVSSSTDDAGLNPDGACSYSTAWNEIYFGECADGSSITSGFRFPNVTIPRGTTIGQAYVTFSVDGLYNNGLTLAFYGEATGNAQPFTLASQPVSRTLTTQSAPWVIPAIDHWVLGQTRQSPELKSIIQAIVSRPDWAEGNALALMVKNSGPASRLHRRVLAYDRLMNLEARLTIITVVPISNLQATNSSPTQLGQPTVLSATVAAGTNITYQWRFGDEQGGGGAVVAHTYPQVGAYVAVVTATNSLGSVTATTPVIITDVPISGLRVMNSSPTQLGRTTVFSATTAVGTNVVYQWRFGDGQGGNGTAPTHTYAAVGPYTAIVTATNSLGTVTATTPVTITDVPISGAGAVNSSPTQLGNATLFTATISSGTGVSYTWNYGDGQNGDGANTTHSYAVAGVYTATVTAANSLGGITATTPVTIIELPQPPLLYLPLIRR